LPIKILIDSDVCLDFITGRKPFHQPADELLSKVENTGLTAIISPHSFSNMFYIFNQKYEAAKVINQLKNLRDIMDVGHLATPEIDGALNSGWNDFEDAIQYHCAKENACDAIITRNRKDFTESTLPILSPAEFLARLHSGEQE
jgi:predicted nucleic acid-binding protein